MELIEDTPMSQVVPTISQQKAASAKAAKRKREAEAGVGSQVGGNKVALAQFNPGRGAEIPWTQQNLLRPIKFKTGEKPGPATVDAYGQERKFFKGQKISTGFAFKAILNADLVQNVDQVPTRFVVHNIFRHTKAEACGVVSGHYNKYSDLWNTTLGPDASFIRQAPGPSHINGGTCYPPATGPGSAVGAGFSASIISPFRYPKSDNLMFSRCTRQNLENFMWNANPMKIAYVQPEVNSNWHDNTTTPLQVLDNAEWDQNGAYYTSHPHQQQTTSSSFDTPITPTNNTGFYYRCQAGIGNVAYHFNNDGTSPMVVDVVVTRLKKGQEISMGNGGFKSAYTTGYMNMTLANRGQFDYFGQPPVATDTFDNARVPFMAAKCLEYSEPMSPIYSSTTPAPGVRPFKQVARDQFIVSGGCTRPWSMDLQSMNYRANDYAQVPEDYDPETETFGDPTKNVDDLSYIISFGFSTLAIPLMEFAATHNGAVVDRVPQSVNCSVTGVYTENVEPVYLSSNSQTPYINGSLDYVWYQDDFPTTLAGIDIANAGNVVRSQTANSAYIHVGPTNTQPGA